MQRLFDHFNLVARCYDRCIGRADDDPLPAIIAAQPGNRVLDVGGGTGRNAGPLAEAGARVTVCDSSLEMLRQACAKSLPAVHADARRLPFADGSFERVIVVDAFHHFVNPTPEVAQPIAAAEMARVTRAGSSIIVEEPDIRKRGVKWIAFGEKLLLMRSRFLQPGELVRIFSAAGAHLSLRSARLRQREDHFNVWLVFDILQMDKVRRTAFPAVAAAESSEGSTGPRQ
jgi:demethylmenaquinone methyltransferase/2-methoxy-6-polyprenyl-1,4-benzoquinol methylase